MTVRTTFEDLKASRPLNAALRAEQAAVERDYALGARIRELRAGRGWDQAHLASEAGVPVETVDMIELGELASNLAELQRICATLEARLELQIVPA
jgi:DNA-binding XRE family transcriptional regulator